MVNSCMSKHCEESSRLKVDREQNSEISEIDLLKYSRQILLPDIGIIGQKFLLSSSVYIQSTQQYSSFLQQQLVPLGITQFAYDDVLATASIYFFSHPKKIVASPVIVVSQSDNTVTFEVIPAGERCIQKYRSQGILVDDLQPILFITAQFIVNLLVELAYQKRICPKLYSFDREFFYCF